MLLLTPYTQSLPSKNMLTFLYLIEVETPANIDFGLNYLAIDQVEKSTVHEMSTANY